MDQRETPDFQAALVYLDDLALMALQVLKVNLASLEYLELVAPLEHPSLAYWAQMVHLAHLAQWDHQDSLDQTVQRETLVLQDLTFQGCQETEEHLVSQVPQVQSEPQDLPEALDEMECQDCQVRKETWVQLVLLDPLEAQVGLADLVDLDLKVSQGSLAETAHLVPLVSKEREVILVCRDHRDQVCHHL